MRFYSTKISDEGLQIQGNSLCNYIHNESIEVVKELIVACQLCLSRLLC